MKKYFTLLLIAMIVLMNGCGKQSDTSAAASEVSSVPVVESGAEPESSMEDSRLDMEENEMKTAMLQCTGILSDTEMEAFADTRNPELVSGDYVLLLEGAKLQDADGNALTIADFAPGCHISIQWSGEIMLSEPAQIGVSVLTLEQAAHSDDTSASAAEGEIGPMEQPMLEVSDTVPDLQLMYTAYESNVTAMIPANGGFEWNVTNPETGEGVSMIADAEAMDPTAWEPTENEIIKAEGVETITLAAVPQWGSVSVQVCTHQGIETAWEDVAVAEDGSFQPHTGTNIYVISLTWENELYSGYAEYRVQIVA